MISYELVNDKLKKGLLYFGIALFPFQNLSLKLSASYDFSSFFLWIYIILISFQIKKKDIDKKLRVNLNYLAIFFVVQIIIFFFTQTPFYRFVSGLFWFGGLLLIFVFKEKVKIDFLIAYKVIVTTLFFTSFVVFVEYFLNYNKTPKGFFSEPSYAGLALFSASASYFGCFLFSQKTSKQSIIIFFMGILFFIAGYLTKSAHIFSFILVIFFTLYTTLKKNKFFILFLFAVLLILLIFNSDHYLDRINTFKIIFNEDYFLNFNNKDLERNFNVSSLCWLDGFKQALTAIKINPFTGLGLGSTGCFHYESVYDSMLLKIHGSNPNKFDSYSGLFRLIIELGVIFTFILLIYLFKSLSFFKFKIQPSFELLFLRFFSLTMIIGLLVKEPTYSRSIVYVSILLFAACFISPGKTKL